jgi:hypothetical protein
LLSSACRNACNEAEELLPDVSLGVEPLPPLPVVDGVLV